MLCGAREAEVYPLAYSVVFDPSSTITVINQEYRLVNIRLAPYGDFIWLGDRKLPITAYSTMTVGAGYTTLMLLYVAYCPSLLTTLVLFRALRRRGMYWDNRRDPTTLYRRDDSVIYQLIDKYG